MDSVDSRHKFFFGLLKVNNFFGWLFVVLIITAPIGILLLVAGHRALIEIENEKNTRETNYLLRKLLADNHSGLINISDTTQQPRKQPSETNKQPPESSSDLTSTDNQVNEDIKAKRSNEPNSVLDEDMSTMSEEASSKSIGGVPTKSDGVEKACMLCGHIVVTKQKTLQCPNCHRWTTFL
jgi:rubrerythrin